MVAFMCLKNITIYFGRPEIIEFSQLPEADNGSRTRLSSLGS